MQKIELTKKVIIELFVIAGLFLVLLFFAVSQKVTIGQKYQQVYFNGELVGNIAGHVSVDDAVHEVRRELAAESDEPLCMDYEYSSSKANDWFTPLMTEDALKEALKEKMKVSEIETQVRAYTVAIEGYRGNFKSMDEVTEFLNTVKNEADTEGQYTTQISKEAGHISGIYTAQLTEVDPKENTEVTPEVTLADQVSAGANGAFTYQMVLDPVCFGHYPENCGPGLRRMTEALSAEELAVIHIRPDFIGLNIYNGHAVCAGTGKRPVYVPRPRGCAVTALKWPVAPLVMNWGVRFLWQRYGRPIYITENGQSCNDRIFLDGRVHDPDRIDFLHRYLLALRAAAEGGADVRGYFHWALTDNFEWSEGYRERFGLVYIDYVTGARIPKDSAAWYAETVRANGENL